MGIALGKRSGWLPKRVDALNQQKLAMLEAQSEAGSADNDTWSCSSVEHGNAFWRQRLRVGELGASRDAMAQTGESAEELARRFGDDQLMG